MVVEKCPQRELFQTVNFDCCKLCNYPESSYNLAENSKEIDGEAFNCMYFLHTALMSLSCLPVVAVSVAACCLCRGEPGTTMAIDFPLLEKRASQMAAG